MISFGPTAHSATRAALLCAFLIAGHSPLEAQQPIGKKPSNPAPDSPSAKELAAQQGAARDLEKRLPVPKAERSLSFALSTSRQERLEKFLPRAFRKLSQREPFHILAIGDPSIVVKSAGENSARPDQSFPAVFAAELANQFFYTGGIQVVGDKTDSTAAERARLGPQIGIRTLTRVGGSVLDAHQILATTARQGRADLLLIAFGLEDARMGTDPAAFRRAIEETIDAAHALNLDVILCSPMPTIGSTPETSLAMARPYAEALRRVAQEEGVLFADLGNLSEFVNAEGTDGLDSDHFFDGLMKVFRGQFLQTSDTVFEARTSMHARLGSMVFNTLLDGPATVPWQIGRATMTTKSKDTMTVRYEISNTSLKPLELTLLPLVAAGWKPAKAIPRTSLAAGEHKIIDLDYTLRDARYSLPAQENYLVLPLLASTASVTRLEEVSAQIQPVAVRWGLETFFNQEGSFSPACLLVNSGTQLVKGTWEAELLGKKLTGNFEVKADSTQPIDLTFDLPKSLEGRVNSALLLKVKTGESELVTERQVEFTHNMGLNEPRSLFTTDPKAPKDASVTLRAEADSGKLFLTCELTGLDLADDPKITPSWQMEVNLDARSYGKRQTRGSTASLIISGSAREVEGKVLAVEPWSFGDEYGAVFDPKEFKTTISSNSSGARKITLAIPRTYLYLHEWAVGNGNSQFGLNVRLSLLQFADATGSSPRFVTFSLVDSSKHPDDAESLMVLELTDKPTQRATVNVH